MDWLHCNKCFAQQTDLPLHCTSCCHIFCASCIQKPCPICKKNFQVVEIGAKMPHTLHYFFDDILKTTKRLQEAIKFQFQHRNNIEMRKIGIFDEIMKLKRIKVEQEKKAILLIHEIKKEKAKLKKLYMFIELCKRNNSKNLFEGSPAPTTTLQGSKTNKASFNKSQRKDLGFSGIIGGISSDSLKSTSIMSRRSPLDGVEASNLSRVPSVTSIGRSSTFRTAKRADSLRPQLKLESQNVKTHRQCPDETGYGSLNTSQAHQSTKYLDPFKFGSLF